MLGRLPVSRSAWGVSALLLLGSSAAFAGVAPPPIAGAVTFAPLAAAANASAVPSLSSWGLVALVVLFSAVIYRVLRTQLGGRPLASMVLAGALCLGVASGIPAVRPAVAVGTTTVSVDLSTGTGGRVEFDFPAGTFAGVLKISNSTIKAQKITGMTVDAPLRFDYEGTPPVCAVGLVVPSGGICTVGVFAPN